MSGKIKSKDLSYDSTLPPFLQQLRAQHTGQGDTDRHERQVARPKKAKDSNEDDGPTVVDESGDIISKSEFEQLTSAAKDAEKETTNQSNTGSKVSQPSASYADGTGGNKHTQEITDGMVQKKRKVGKVIGSDEIDDAPEEGSSLEKKAFKKPKKKAKAIKLVFDDDGS